MKCINCYKKEYSKCKTDEDIKNINTIYLRQNMGGNIAPIYQRRVLVCEKCGARITTLETIADRPIIQIDGEIYSKLKHVTSIVEALGSSRQEAYNIASEIADKFISTIYKNYLLTKEKKKEKKSEKVIKLSKKDLFTFTVNELGHHKNESNNVKWGLKPDYDLRYLANHDLDLFVKVIREDK